ncbi:MAG: methyltetrahydrofolate cobalamin methyltransferase [Oscillospiraceae bacterium]|nr:methyltetrahydrofolate cobalamin methyltransferase [Oscillospiraceae bacterium]
MIIIGEKINGSIPSAGKAIAERNEEWIRHLARIQEDANADYIDCCASVNVDELQTMKWLLDIIQDETSAKICVDSPDPRVCVDALQYCKKPGLVNSVSLEGDKIDVIFPAIAETKWNCVALLSGEQGIPSSAEERLENFKRLMDKAAKYGIAPKRLFIDPLVEGLATNQESLLTFNATCRGIKELFPDVHITSGLSNISFGLPVRKMLNMAFMTLAMQAGMDSAIVDPTNRDMMGIIYATQALLGEDDYCVEYIGAYRENLFGPIQA